MRSDWLSFRCARTIVDPGRFTDLSQVLTGEIPFPGCGPVGCIFSVVTDGQRPIKPDNASAIGFSDQLWVFVERCWDANMRLRPEVAEVVMQLSSATAGWNGVMPPHVKVKCVAENPTAESDSRKYRKLVLWLFLNVSHRATAQGGSSGSLRVPLRKTPPTQELYFHHSPMRIHHPPSSPVPRKNPKSSPQKSSYGSPRGQTRNCATRILAKTTDLHCRCFPRRNGRASSI